MIIKSGEHKSQEAFQNRDEFKGKAKSRYKIKAKNSEFKHLNGYDGASYANVITSVLRTFKVEVSYSGLNKAKENKILIY